jgi:cytochrome c peroxidase
LQFDIAGNINEVAMRRVAKGLGLVLVLLVVVPIVLCLGLGLLPAPSDPILPPEEIVVGAQNAGESAINMEFPDLVEPADNPGTPEKVLLGELLFFDPILSTNDDISCATCHHPDFGFSDGRATGMGAGGSGIGINRVDGMELTRNVPTLYEVGYAPALFWDGRAATLEAQVQTPLTEAIEMHSTADEAIGEIAAIESYREIFEATFPNEENPVTYDNLTRALAAYQRGIDRFAKTGVRPGPQWSHRLLPLPCRTPFYEQRVCSDGGFGGGWAVG